MLCLHALIKRKSSQLLSPEARAEALINEQTVHGNRYSDQSRSEVDTEEF